VTLGQFFEQTVTYKNLRPTIIGSGLGLTWVSWQVKNEAVRPWSHRFTAIISVPKGTREADITVSGHLRIKPSYI
jgi:hypothetical protein